MSSRTEKDDPWRHLSFRTTDRGPRSRLPCAAGAGAQRMKAGGTMIPGSRSPGGQRRVSGQGQESNAGWTIFGYMISGMAAYGGIGWLVGHFAHLPLLFPVGMLVGIVLAIVGIVYRYGRP